MQEPVEIRRSNHSSLRRPPFRRPKLAPFRIVAISLLRLRAPPLQSVVVKMSEGKAEARAEEEVGAGKKRPLRRKA